MTPTMIIIPSSRKMTFQSMPACWEKNASLPGTRPSNAIMPGKDVFFSEHAGIDWNVIFLLLGMMIIVGVIKQTGVFEFHAMSRPWCCS